jgi:hypothetical protein
VSANADTDRGASPERWTPAAAAASNGVTVRSPRKALRFALAVAVALAACEVALRLVSRVDRDGNVSVAGIARPPRRPPLRAIAESLERYRAAPAPFLVPDPDLGWAPRPGATSRDGLATIDARGARVAGADAGGALGDDGAAAPARTSPSQGTAPGSRPVVALFGDSFTFGDESPYDDTWGAALERELRERGCDAEVVNLGVNAYGLDQAYLRWRKSGRPLRPSLVVVGFQPENLLRDLNVFRPLYFAGTEIPLSKPRFVLADDGLRIVNSPALPPGGVLDALSRLDRHPLAPHERFHDPDAASRWWLRSRLVALVAALTGAGSRVPSADPYAAAAADHEAREIGRRLVARFAREVAADGGELVVVYLPRREELERIAAGDPIWDGDRVREVVGTARLVEPQGEMLPLREDDFCPAGHYGRRLDAAVGREVASGVIAAWCTSAPPAGCRAACE